LGGVGGSHRRWRVSTDAQVRGFYGEKNKADKPNARRSVLRGIHFTITTRRCNEEDAVSGKRGTKFVGDPSTKGGLTFGTVGA